MILSPMPPDFIDMGSEVLVAYSCREAGRLMGYVLRARGYGRTEWYAFLPDSRFFAYQCLTRRAAVEALVEGESFIPSGARIHGPASPQRAH